MAYGFKFDSIMTKPIKEMSINLLKKLEVEGWSIIYNETFRKINSKEVFEILGVTSSFGGITPLSLTMHGARSVSFFIKITEIKYDKSSLLIITSGSQSMFETDWGRNSKVGEKLFEFCTLVSYKNR
jgi:hypothetical protein